jgi:hypothetical protein
MVGEEADKESQCWRGDPVPCAIYLVAVFPGGYFAVWDLPREAARQLARRMSERMVLLSCHSQQKARVRGRAAAEQTKGDLPAGKPLNGWPGGFAGRDSVPANLWSPGANLLT